MKYSQMIHLIEDVLNDRKGFPSINNTANRILEELESAGMLPNTICYNAVGEYEDINKTDILHDNDISFAWEPEDEEK